MSKQRIAVGIVMLGVAAGAHAGVNTWTALGPEGGDIREIAMHPTDPDTAVAIAFSGVYRTTNGGAAWTKSAQQFQNPPYDMQVDPSDPDRIYVSAFSNPHVVVSTDGGVTFGPFPPPPVTTPSEPRLGLGIDGVVYFGTGLSVFRSDDRGANWTAKTSIAQPTGHIRWLVVDPVDPYTVYAAAGPDVAAPLLFVSHDGAASWAQQPRGVTSLVPHPTVSGELWSAQREGLLKSQDHGATWSNVAFPMGVYELALNMRAGGLDIIASTYNNGISRSMNGGTNWTDITGDLPRSLQHVSAHAVDADRIMLSDGRGVRVPGPSPGTWVSRNSGIVATDIRKLTADATTDRIYAFTGQTHVSIGGGTYAAIDDAPLAAVASAPPPLFATTIHGEPGGLLALLSTEVARSTDGGASWSLIPDTWAEPPPQLWQLASAGGNPANLITAGAPRAFRSADGGASWTRISAGLPGEFATFDIEFAESDPSVVYFGPYVLALGPPQVFGVYRSTDGGTNWVPANAGIADVGAYDIEVDPTDSRVVYAIAGTALVKSTDSGGTWRTLRTSLSSSARIAIDPVVPRVLYVISGDNLILRSVNGGESFETLRDFPAIPWWHPRSVIVDPQRSVVSVGTGGFGVQQMSVEPDLELGMALTPSSSVAPGATLSYTLFATNKGPFASSGARVAIQFSAGMANVTATSQGGSCSVQQNTAVCTLNALAVNGSIGVTLSAAPQSPGLATVSATVQGDQRDPVASNDAASFSVDVPPATPDTPAPPVSSGGGGGGGGGGMSLLWLLVAALARDLPTKLRERVRTLAPARAG